MMIKKSIDQLRVNAADLNNLQGFSVDLIDSITNAGSNQSSYRVMDIEFASNMGVLCTALSISLTKGMVDGNWRFSQYGILYLVDRIENINFYGVPELEYNLNHGEFSLLIAILACRENIIDALKGGIVNQFRISLFYLNVLTYYLDSIKGVDSNKVTKILSQCKNECYAAHELHFDQYLNEIKEFI